MASNPAPTASTTTAANDAGPARLPSADRATHTSDGAGTAGCNDPISDALRPEDLARLEALERRVDAFEAHIARELQELKDWMNAQFQELARRIEAQDTRQARMQAELDELRAQLRRVESELRTLTAETQPICMAAPRDLATQGEPALQDSVRDAGEAGTADTKHHSEDPTQEAATDATAIDVPEAQRGESQVEERSSTGAGGAQVERQDIPPRRELVEPATCDSNTSPANKPQVVESGSVEVQVADPVEHDVPLEVVDSRASPVPLAAANPQSFDERFAAAEARIEAGHHIVAELKGDMVQRVRELFQKQGKDETK